MVDPKFNELPVPVEEVGKKKVVNGAKAPRGLSINDTIAADANKSIGAGGVDTSNATAGFDGHDAGAVVELEPISSQFSRDEIAQRAFELWHERGCPVGSPDVDWKEAEQDLLSRSRGSKAAVAGA
jgi:Protein of unknown function (DUF2934)